jgi:uncharacterized protein (DUF1499 family)
VTSDDASLPDNPLPPCPDTPNCERQARSFAHDPKMLFGAVQSVLASMGPIEMNVQPSDCSVRVVFRVALVFKDDVHVAIRPHGDTGSNSVLFIRSASRTGQYDFGVNRRRVQQFFRRVEEKV